MSNGDDADARAVLADELLERGDQRGELIQLQLALEQLATDSSSDRMRAVRRRRLEERLAQVLDALHETLYGDLAPYVTRRSASDLFDPAAEVVTWRTGRAETMWLQTTRRGFGLADAYRALTRCTLADGVRRLEIGHGYHEAFANAACADPLPALRSLLLGSDRRAIPILPMIELSSLGLLSGLLGQLEELDVTYALAVVPFASPTLRRVQLRSTRDTVFDAELPALEDLQLVGMHIEPERLVRFPALRRLAWHNSTTPGWVARFLATDHGITTLHYSGHFSAVDAAAVLHAGDRIAMTLSARYEDREVLAGLRDKVPPCIELAD